MSKQTFLELLHAETEAEIEEIIKKYDMDGAEYWIPYGKQDSNWSIIGNQSSSAEKALVEKITNSVDAVVMRRCLELGIDPRGKEAPNSPREALKTFFDIDYGKMGNTTDTYADQVSGQIYLMATSKDMKPIKRLGRGAHINLCLFDSGEGQSPNRLDDTILSLLRGNKQGIPFTQGNYNQGGSGALMYCGEKGYCLVVSKRCTTIHPNRIDESDDSIDKWGWTLTRLEMRKDTKDPMFTYYAPNGKIMRFDAETLPLKPEVIKGEQAKRYLEYEGSCTAGLPYKVEVPYGTAIKMFNYSLKQKGPLVSHFKYEISKCILDTYLPITLVDCRKNKYNNEIYFRGFNKLLEDDMKEKDPANRLINENFPIKTTFKVGVQDVVITAYGLNRRKGGKKDHNSFIGEHSPIRFTLGQQFQGEMSKAIISNSGLGIIKDQLLLIVEFPNIDANFKKDLFMTDRERLLDKAPKKEIIDQIKSFLTHDPTLQQFASDQMSQRVQEESESKEGVKSALEKWIKQDPNIQRALGFGKLLASFRKVTQKSDDGEPGMDNPGGGVSVPLEAEKIETKFFPTYFIPVLNKKDNKYQKSVVKGSSFSIKCKTDMNEDFFDRFDRPGYVSLKYNGEEVTHVNRVVKNGKVSFNFTKKVATKLGEQKLTIKVGCVEGDVFYYYEVDLHVIDKKKDPVKPKEDEKKQYNGLPHFELVYKDDWTEEMNEETGAGLQTFRDETRYLINMDNLYLRNKLDSIKTEGEKEYYKQSYIYSMLLSAIALKNHEEEKKKSASIEEEKPIEEVVTKSMETVARTFFITEQLSADMRKNFVDN